MKKAIGILLIAMLMASTVFAAGIQPKTSNFKYQVKTGTTPGNYWLPDGKPNYNLDADGARVLSPVTVPKYVKNWLGQTKLVAACEYPPSTWLPGSAYLCYDSTYPQNDNPI